MHCPKRILKYKSTATVLSSFMVEMTHYFCSYLEITHVTALNKTTFLWKNKSNGPFGLELPPHTAPRML
jgi:hypothetical protein